MDIDFDIFASLKGEFEAEGLSRDEIAAEALYAARHGLDYLVKISACEAKADVHYLAALGIDAIVAPMVESPFAMQKYMEMVRDLPFAHLGVTIETITAVANIDAILERGTRLTEVTIGRTDLTASYAGASVESERTMAMVRQVATAARAKGLKVTMGGSISKATRATLLADPALCALLDYIETRKAVMPVARFLDEAALGHALQLEQELLARRVAGPRRLLAGAEQRLAQLASRG